MVPPLVYLRLLFSLVLAAFIGFRLLPLEIIANAFALILSAVSLDIFRINQHV
jgi:hypothetical protein